MLQLQLEGLREERVRLVAEYFNVKGVQAVELAIDFFIEHQIGHAEYYRFEAEQRLKQYRETHAIMP